MHTDRQLVPGDGLLFERLGIGVVRKPLVEIIACAEPCPAIGPEPG